MRAIRFSFASCTPCAYISSSLLLAASILAGCISFGAKPSDAKSNAYVVAKPTAPWEPTDPGTMDLAYRMPGDGSTLSLNSVCEQYQKNSLEELRTSSLAGIGIEKRITERSLTVGGYPALESVVVGRLDGALFKLAHTVFRTPTCVYDISFVSRPETFETHEAFYASFLASFKEREPSS